MSAKGWIGDLTSHVFTWDVSSSQGGAVGTILLGNLPDGFVITECYANARTALTGGGTVVCGQDGGGDDDGYFTNLDAIAVATPLRGTGALVVSTGEEVVNKVVAANDGVQLTIATAAYTAGLVDIVFIGFQG